MAREVDPTADPLGPANKIVFAPGLLSGTTAPNSSRLSVGCKSPLTGGIKEANSGGQAAGRLGRLGIAAIVVEGDPGGKKWVLQVTKDGATLEDGGAFWGLGNYDTSDALRAKYGPKVACIQVRPGRRVRHAQLVGRRHRPRGQSGPARRSRRRGRRHGRPGPQGHRRRRRRRREGAPADAERFDKARKTLVDGPARPTRSPARV